MNASERLIKAVAVTAELTGTTLSREAARVLVDDLSGYPEPQVLGALNRCRRELRGRLTVHEVLSRIEDGRPTPEEAWAMIPRDEASSVVWTEEMRAAFAVVAQLVADGEHIAARMAFLEAYRKLAQQARDARTPVQWSASLGHDKSGRELVLLDAVEKGRISADGARALLPYHREDEGLNARLLALAGGLKRLAA